MNCKDESDEDTCNLIVFKNNYNKKVPPFTVMADFSVLPAKILVSTKLENVLAISEFSHTIDLKIQIKLRWYENRVLYHNLKFQEALNILTDSEVINIYIHYQENTHAQTVIFQISKIWMPYIIFKNTDDDEAVKIDALTEDGNIRTRISVRREHNFTRSSPEVADEVLQTINLL